MLLMSVMLMLFWGGKVSQKVTKIYRPSLSMYTGRAEFTWTSIGPEGGEVSRISSNTTNPNQKIAVSYRLWNKQGGNPWMPVLNLWHSIDGTYTGPNKALVAFEEGAYYSNDGGISWFLSLSYSNFQALSEEKSDTLYLVADNTVFLTTDGGLTFQTVSPVGFEIKGIDFSPQNPSVLFASVLIGDTAIALVKSSDAGTTWSWSIPPNSPFNLTDIYDIEVNPWNPDEILLAVVQEGPGTILISEDGGTTWDTLMSAFLSGLFFSKDIEYVTSDTILVANIFPKGIFVGYRIGPIFFFQKIDSTAFPMDIDLGSDGAINVATTSGVLRSNGIGLPFTWENEGLNNNFVFREPQWSNMVGDRLFLLPSMMGGVIYRTSDGGVTWDRVILDNIVAISSIRISKTDPDIVYLTGVGGDFINGQITVHTIYKSDDFGNTWTPMNNYALNEYFPFLLDLHISPSNTNDLLIVSEDTLYRSVDGGTNMTPLLPRVYPYLPGASEFVFIYKEDTGELLYTTDHGDNWQSVGLFFDYPSNLELNPMDQSLYLPTFNSGTGSFNLLRIYTTGAIDTLLDLGPNAHTVGLEFADNGGVYLNYLATDIFVFGRSYDFGFNWEFDTTGEFPGVFIRASANQVVLSTYGLSLYRSEDAVTGIKVARPPFPQNDFYIINPIVSDILNIITDRRESGSLNAQIFNTLGRLLYETRFQITPNKPSIGIRVKMLPDGIYYLRLLIPERGSRVVRFVKIGVK